jgi:hypothetical protein
LESIPHRERYILANLSLLILIIPILLILLAGWAIRYKQAYWLISGYNTMSTEKKRQVNIEPLGRLIANMCFLMAGIIATGIGLITLGWDLAAMICFGTLIPVIIYTLIHAQRYDGNTRNPDGTMKTTTKIFLGAIISFLILLSVGIGILFYVSNQPIEVTLDEDKIQVSGIYGMTVPLEEIMQLQLLEEMPEVIRRTNGYASNKNWRGSFRLEGVGRAKLFIDRSIPLYIYIETSDQDKLYFNFPTLEETRKLYQNLYEKTNK